MAQPVAKVRLIQFIQNPTKSTSVSWLYARKPADYAATQIEKILRTDIGASPEDDIQFKSTSEHGGLLLLEGIADSILQGCAHEHTELDEGTAVLKVQLLLKRAKPASTSARGRGKLRPALMHCRPYTGCSRPSVSVRIYAMCLHGPTALWHCARWHPGSARTCTRCRNLPAFAPRFRGLTDTVVFLAGGSTTTDLASDPKEDLPKFVKKPLSGYIDKWHPRITKTELVSLSFNGMKCVDGMYICT